MYSCALSSRPAQEARTAERIRSNHKGDDTQTSQESDINLGDVNGVVNALNEADPGRYVQVPLRDEVGR